LKLAVLKVKAIEDALKTIGDKITIIATANAAAADGGGKYAFKF